MRKLEKGRGSRHETVSATLLPCQLPISARSCFKGFQKDMKEKEWPSQRPGLEYEKRERERGKNLDDMSMTMGRSHNQRCP